MTPDGIFALYGDGAKILLWGAWIAAAIALVVYVVFKFDELTEKIDDIADKLSRPKPKSEDMDPIEVMPETVVDSVPPSAIVPMPSTAKAEEPTPAPGFNHSEDFRSVTAHGKTFSLTLYQSRALEKLWKARKNLIPELHQAVILEGIESCSKRLRDVFKSNMEAYRALITRGERKGTFRLRLS